MAWDPLLLIPHRKKSWKRILGGASDLANLDPESPRKCGEVPQFKLPAAFSGIILLNLPNSRSRL